MRLYYVDEDPIVAADSLSTKTTSQSILYYSQLLCNTHHFYGQTVEGMYKPNQMQHSYTQWICEAEGNYQWVLRSLIKLLMNYSEHRHKEHKTRNTVNYLVKPPIGMKKGTTPITTKALPEQYKEYLDPIEAHRAYYSYSLKKLIYQGARVEFYYRIPEWTTLIEIQREPERVKDYIKFSKAPMHKYERETCNIPIIASSIKDYSKQNEVIEVDIRTVAEIEEDD